LIESLTFGAIDVSLEDKRTVPDSGERARRDRQVVADHVKFRELCLLREIQFARVSNTDLASIDREQLGSVFLPHKLSLHDWRDVSGFVRTLVTDQSLSPMKIATFNVNGISARLSALLRWLAESKPDVACLQELKAPQEKLPEATIRGAGYGVIWHGQKSWNGVAMLTRGADPVESLRGLPGDPEDIRSRYIEALINGVRVDVFIYPTAI
jgi:hypothetical protein